MDIYRKKQIFSTYQIIAISFFSLILTGTLLLMLPLSSSTGESLRFVDALFMATSAVCVTGLTVIDIGNQFSLFGQLVFIVLIQCGGLSLMTFATVFLVAFGKRVIYPDRILMRDALSQGSLSGIVRLTLNLFKMSLLIEFIFGTILALRFYQDYGLKGIYFGYWHSVSAFCNAGFDLLGHFQSITPYVGDWTINLCLTTLIILGGLGFNVHLEVFSRKKIKDYTLHTKIVLLFTFLLIVPGTLIFFALEYTNPNTLANLPFNEQLLSSYFQTVSPRTAGFNSLDLQQLHPVTIFYIVLLMFVGASPSSTGGGIKTTTFAVILMSAWALVRGKSDTTFFGRRIGEEVIHKAFVITGISALIVTAGVFAVTLLEEQPFLYIVFETVSAFATVGLTAGITTELCDASKIILSMTMFVGRVGPFTLAAALALREKRGSVRYPEENITVG